MRLKNYCPEFRPMKRYRALVTKALKKRKSGNVPQEKSTKLPTSRRWKIFKEKYKKSV